MEPVECAFMAADKGREAMEEYLAPDSSQIDRYRWMAKNSPMLYYVEKSVGNNVPNRNKIMRFL